MNKEQKEFAARIGIELKAKHKALSEAVGADAIQHASIQLGIHFNTHIEAIIWILRDAGGIKQRPLEKVLMGKQAVPKAPPELPKMPDSLKIPELKIACQCPPLEPGIIGSKHMTSCPEYGR